MKTFLQLLSIAAALAGVCVGAAMIGPIDTPHHTNVSQSAHAASTPRTDTGVAIPIYPVATLCRESMYGQADCTVDAQQRYDHIKSMWPQYSANVQLHCIDYASTSHTYKAPITGGIVDDTYKPYFGLYMCLLGSYNADEEAKKNRPAPAFKP